MIKFLQPKGGRQGDQNQIAPEKKVSAGLLRLLKDKEELDIPSNMKIEWSNPEDLTQFKIIVSPQECSLWKKGSYIFSCLITPEYPYEPPKLECLTKIFHPNIDLQGKVCLNILRMDWKPIFNINTVLMGINTLFNEPNENDPLNKDAGELMRKSIDEFKDVVFKTLKGQSYKGENFPKFI